MKRILSILIGVMLAVLPAISVISELSFHQDPDAIEEAIKSVLFIAIFDSNDEIVATGSGFIAFNNRTIITNYHVIEDADSIWASDEANVIYEIDRILVLDEERDIAILLIKSATDLIPLKLAEISVLKRGQPVTAIGSPEGYVNTVSTGIISALYDRNNTPDIQFTAPVSHGSSGGALFNETGEVIGVTSASNEGGQNLNFAIGIYHIIDLYQRYNPNYTPIKTSATATPRIIATPTQKPTEKPKLSAPTIITAKVIEKTVTVSWNAVKGAERYSVYRSSTINNTLILIGTTTGTTYKDNMLREGETYSYAIRSDNSDQGISDISNKISVYIVRATPSPKPTPISTPKPTPSNTPSHKPIPTSTAPPISFITPEDIVKYKTLKAGMKDPDVAKLKERMFELGYFTNKTVNNTYTATTAEYVKEFQRANGLMVDGVASPEMQALFFSKYAIPKPTSIPLPPPTPKPTPRLTKPSNVKVSLLGSDATISWKSVKDAAEYRVSRSEKSNGFYTLIGTTKKLTFTDRKTTRGKTYYYKVESVNGKNVSDKSSYAKAVMPKPTPKPYVEPTYPLDFGDSGYIGTARNPYLNPKMVNISGKKTVDGFTLTYYCTDVYGEKLFFNKTSNYTSIYTYTKTIKPGKTAYPGEVSLDLYGYGIVRVYVAISKIHTTDGKTYKIPESQLDYYYWELD